MVTVTTVTFADTIKGGFELSGNQVYAGAAAAGNSWIWQAGGLISGTATAPSDGQIAPFHLSFNDTVDASASSNGLAGLSVLDAPGTAHAGNRAAVQGYTPVVGAPTSGNYNYVGVLGLCRISVNLNGAAGAITNYRGAGFGGNSNFFTTSGATFLSLATGHEFDLTVATGSSAARKLGIMIVQGANDAVRGTYEDHAIQIASQSASTTWTTGLCFGAYSAQWAFGADSTLIGAQARVSPAPSTPIALWGVDFSGVTFQAGGGFLKSTGFNVDLSGVVQFPSFTVAGMPTASPAGRQIYVSNESGGAVMAFSDGTNWRRVTDRAIVS